jgi:hypothetical protein
MKTVNIDTLLPKIVPLLPGCNDAIAKIALMDAARTFARESDCIVETRGYPEDLAPGYGRMPEMSLDPDNFLPHHFIYRKEDHSIKRVYVTYSLLPIGNVMPESIVTRYYEAIVNLALAMLYQQPGKPWSNPNLYPYYQQKYQMSLGDAVRDTQSGGAVFDQSIYIGDPSEPGFMGNITVNATVIGTDTSGGTITPQMVLAGKIGFSNGEKIIGEIPYVTPQIAGNVFSVKSGYVSSDTTLIVTESKFSATDDEYVISPGYVKEEIRIPNTADELTEALDVIEATQTALEEI